VPVTPQPLTVTAHPKKVAFVLGVIATLLLLAHFASLVMRHALDHDYVYGLVPLFTLDEEQNAPTLFNSCLFLIASLLFLAVWQAGRVRREPRLVWAVLSALFVFLALDETATLHEQLIRPVRSALDLSGYLYFAWVIPYAIALLVLSLFVIPVFWRLGKRFRFWFGLSALTYLAGAIGVEMITAKRFELLQEQKDLPFRLMTAVEESLEMLGLILLIYTLMLLLQTKYGGLTLRIPNSND
jgi:hypothetical protein